jgi:hypothetical protein
MTGDAFWPKAVFFATIIVTVAVLLAIVRT